MNKHKRMTTTKHIAVLLTCYNRKEKTLNCLQSFYSNSLPENYQADIFLVDDGSTDGTGDAVKAKFPDVNIIEGTGSLYWNRGMHRAWETAAKTKDYDFYLWLNDDVEILPHAISELINITAANRYNSIVVGTMQSKTSGLMTYGGYNEGNLVIEPNNTLQTCKKFNGNLVLIPKSAYKLIGNLDPHFPHAIGDFDYALRAHKLGVKSYISNSVSGYCEEHEHLPLWCLPHVPFKKRLITLYSPLGNAHPKYFFYFEKRHYGVLTAIKHYFTIHLRATFPKLWK